MPNFDMKDKEMLLQFLISGGLQNSSWEVEQNKLSKMSFSSFHFLVYTVTEQIFAMQSVSVTRPEAVCYERHCSFLCNSEIRSREVAGHSSACGSS